MPDNLKGEDRREYMREYYRKRYVGQKCKHCKTNQCTRPRGLCYGCFNNLAIRNLYAMSSNPCNRRGIGNVRGFAPLPKTPTMTAPGTEARMLVYEQRAREKVALHHPLDRRI